MKGLRTFDMDLFGGFSSIKYCYICHFISWNQKSVICTDDDISKRDVIFDELVTTSRNCLIELIYNKHVGHESITRKMVLHCAFFPCCRISRITCCSESESSMST